MTAFGTEVCNALVLQGGLSASPSSLGPMGVNWAVLTLLGVAVSLFMMALVYMFANVLRNQSLIAWSKFELFQVLASVVLFVAVWLMLHGACSFNMGFLTQSYNGQNMYDIVGSYFDRLKIMGYYLFAGLMYVVKQINLLSKVMWLSSPLGLGMQDSPLESLGQINSVFFFVIGGYFTSMMLLWLQVRMMDYMAYASVFYLMPFGIVLRAFEPVRKFGGTLMGIALAFLLFYPMVIVFNDFIIGTSLQYELEQQGLVETLKGFDDGLNSTGESIYVNPRTIKDSYEQIRDTQAKTGDDSYEKIAGIGVSVTNGAFVLLRPIMIYVIAAVVLPVIDFIVLVEVARALTKMLGEEVDVSNLTRLI